MLTSPDPTWAITQAMYWSVIETNIGILATSIPSFKALAKRYIPRILGESYGNSWHSSSQQSARKGSRPFNNIEEEQQSGSVDLSHMGHQPPPVASDSEYKRARTLSGLHKNPVTETSMSWDDKRTSEKSII